MGLVKKLYRASDLRKSRLHDEKGHLVDFAGLCYAPIAIGTGLLRKLFNRRPKMPWISYRAIKKLDQLIQPDWQVIEFGSGSSTAWIAKRCGFLYSIEDHEQWHQFVSDQLKSQGISNIKYEFRMEEEYTDLSSIEDASLDFALIDGINRSGCMREVLSKIKKGGYVYLDNSDKYANEPEGDVRVAENLLIEAVKERNGTLQYFVDFAPAQFFVEEGVLAQL